MTRGRTANINGPTETDGRQVVTLSPTSLTRRTFFSGAGDLIGDPRPSARGGGEAISAFWTGTEEGEDLYKKIRVKFKEPVEIHDGHAHWKPIDMFTELDRLSMSISIPASTPTLTVDSQGVGKGNLDLIDYPVGHPYAAAGLKRFVYNPDHTGQFNVNASGEGLINDFSDVSPVDIRIPKDDLDHIAVGGWDVDLVTGNLTPNLDMEGDYDLWPVPIESFFMKSIGLGSPIGTFDIDTYRVEWVHHSWELVVHIDKHEDSWDKYMPAGPCEFGGWLLFYRAGLG